MSWKIPHLLWGGNLWTLGGFVSHAMVLHLKAILTLVCLNRLVTLHMCGKVKVKVAHFVLFPVFMGGAACVVFGILLCGVG